MGQRVLVTGGGGFIGSNLVGYLARQNCDLTVLDDFSNGKVDNITESDVEIIRGDIRDESLVTKLLSRRFDYIFHLAARGSVPRSILDPDTTHDINVNGTLNILNCLRKYPSRLIFSSSSSVYGKNAKHPKNELDWTLPLTPYAASKANCENIISAYSSSYSIPSLIVRFFNVYGPKQRADIDFPAVLPKWIDLLLRGKSLTINGDGSVSRDFTFVKDVAEILTKITSENFNFAEFDTVNLAFGKSVQLNEILKILVEFFPEAEYNFTSPRNGDIKDSLNDPAKLINVFGDFAPTSIEDGLAQTIDYMKNLKH